MSAKGNDEIALLARTFNTMSSNLQLSYEALKATNNYLEEKVRERTEELEQKNRQLQQLSITDRLTQCYNRVKMEELLAQQLHLAQRYQTPFSLFIADADHFKQVNDHHGHQMGDKVLIELANRLKEAIRESDAIDRWRGEEFLILCPNTAAEAAQQLAQRLCQTVAATAFSCFNRRMTVSIGVSAHQSSDNSIDSLLERADIALYSAKAEGRNRAVLYRPKAAAS
ncbi:diguanylate cyclase [Ectothiorhodospiraceae bacterium BW-2]|nr:diguanylate cyclase [Ectothiorhodospiraceae bacterium BW-2]